MKKHIVLVLSLIIICGCTEQSTKSYTSIIESEILNKDIKVISYDSNTSINNKPLIYITDGQKAIDNGTLEIIKKLTTEDRINDAVYIFVSTIDSTINSDLRETYFFCNEDYVRFFEEELIPKVEGQFNSKITSAQRSLVGVSFGGLNAAYFSGKTDLFQNYALLSPITYPCQDFMKEIAFSKNKDLRILITSGTNDAENYMTPLLNMYKGKEYEVESFSTEGAHDFENWNGQMDRILNFLNDEI